MEQIKAKKLGVVILLLGFGSWYLIFDYMTTDNIVNDPSYIYGVSQINNPNKTLTLNPFDDHISNLENILIHLSLFFGFMQLYDLLYSKSDAEKDYKQGNSYINLVKRFL